MPTTKEIALSILPFLVSEARQGHTIEYGVLASRAGMKHHRPIPKALGYIRDQVCAAHGRPMLSAIVVNHQTGLPGESFLPGGTENLTEEECKTRFEELRDEVFQYQGWDELLREQGLEPITPTPDSLDNEALALAEYTFRHGSRPESSEHMGLKQYIARHPELLGLPKGLTGTEEYEFPSGDRCDVVFDVHSAASAVVEVKADIARGELVKGVYQAVKYRALLEAQRGRGGPHQVKAFLVALSVPDEISGFARRLSVIAHRVDRDELSRFDQTPTGQ